METVFLVGNRTGHVRFVTRNGRRWAIAPMTIIVPGVLNGSQGALFYPEEEVALNVDKWNGTPIVLYHPTHLGTPVSARYPGVLDKWGMGFCSNARIVNTNLQCDGWFDLEKTKRIDERVYNALINNQPIELSTGLYTTNKDAPAGKSYNGKPYDKIARNYRPDHLAILPDQIGACSLNDGCGVMVNAEKCPECGAEMKDGECECGYTENEETPAAQESFFRWLARKMGFVGNEIAQGRHPVTYRFQGKAKNAAEKGYRGDEEISSEGKSIEDEGDEIGQGDREGQPRSKEDDIPKETESTTIPVSNEDDMAATATRTVKMTDVQRKEAVKYLTTNCACWKEKGSEEVLNKLSPEQLQGLVDNEMFVVNAKKRAATANMEHGTMEGEDEEEEEEEEVAGKKKPPAPPVPPTKNRKISLDDLEPEDREAVENARAIVKREKKVIINKLLAHIEDEDKKAALTKNLLKKTLPDLQEQLDLMPPQQTNNRRGAGGEWDPEVPLAHYLGMGGSFGTPAQQQQQAGDQTRNRGIIGSTDPDDLLDIPTLNFEDPVEAYEKRRHGQRTASA